MKRLLLTTAMLGALSAPALASIHDMSFSGMFNNGDAFSGSLALDVVGNEAVSGTGTLTTLGMHNAPIVMITSSTAGNELPGIGYRGNDGADYFDLDQAFPISTNGLLFDVGTTTAEWGLHPLFAIWSNSDASYGTAFTGVVGGQEFYNLNSVSASVTGAVPEPSTWAMLGVGFAGLGLAGWKRSRTNRLAVAI